MSNTVFISGEEYNLKNIFGGKAKIVIPDLQRDYCWGLETYDRNNKKTRRIGDTICHRSH